MRRTTPVRSWWKNFRNDAVKLILLIAGALTIFPRLGCSEDAAEKARVYQADVDFLLDELPKRAGRFFELKKIDWSKVTEEFRAEVKNVKTDQEHLKLCARLIARLRDGHAGVV